MECKEYRKLTEKRLYALVDIQARLANDYYMNVNGVRLEEDKTIGEENFRTREDRLWDLREVYMLEDALKSIENAPYYIVILERYIGGKTDEQIAEKLYCEVTTVWRNRMRLLNKMAVRLFGVKVVHSA